MSTPTPPVSVEARAVIAGLIAPEAAAINTAGINASEQVWDEIRTAFPLSLFHAWVQGHGDPVDNDGIGYNPTAGF